LRVEILKYPLDSDWLAVRNAALETQRKHSDKIPSSKLKTKFLLSEHSPIRLLEFSWRFVDLPYWIAMHLRTHHEGLTHFISSQRNDIQHEFDRRKAPQDSLVNHQIIANAQAILNISRARTCNNASLETRQAWRLFLDTLQPFAPELVSVCVKPCIYRNGICPERFKTCGYNLSSKFREELADYFELFVE
jgi:hypothetical protein